MGSYPCPHLRLCTWAILSLLLLLTSSSQVEGQCGPPPRVPFATQRDASTSDSYPNGTRVSYRCNPGYELIPGKIPVLECRVTKWSDENPEFCQGRQCPVPVIDNGDYIAPNGLRLGNEITYTCTHGFRVIGATSARCMLSTDSIVDWSRPPPLCQRIICYPPPVVENGRHSGDSKLDDFVYGDTITYTCNKDYSLIGNATLSCDVAENGLEGVWTPNAPQCKVVNCNRPTIMNGKLTTSFQPSYTYGHTIGFECNPGYTLVGSQTSKCGADNNWNPPVPTCVRGIATTHAPPVTTKAPPVTTKAPTVTTKAPTVTTKAPTVTTKAPTVTTKAPTGHPDRGTTQSSTTQPPKTEPGSGNTIAIAVGAVLASLLGICLVYAAWKYRNKIKNGKTKPGSESSESYRVVSGNPDIVLETKDTQVV